MKRLAFLLLSLIVIACAAAQQYESPQTVEWDAPAVGFADSYEVAIQRDGSGDIAVIGSPVLAEFLVDLEALDLYGRYVILVRSVAFTAPDLYDYSDWIRSDTDADVMQVGGVPQTFTIERKRPAGAPVLLRVR